MGLIDIHQEIDIEEIDGKSTFDLRLFINSHPDVEEWVGLVIGGHVYAVNGKVLITACKNALNTEKL